MCNLFIQLRVVHVSRLCVLALVLASSAHVQALDVEQFTLVDGREIIGIYDETNGRLSAVTPSGRIVVDVAKELIVKRKPSVVPEYVAPAPAPVPAAPVVEVVEKPAAPVVPIAAKPKPLAPPAPMPLGKAGSENQAKVVDAAPAIDPRRKQMMDLVRQMSQLQQAAAGGDAAAAQQLQNMQKQIEAIVGPPKIENRVP